MGVDIAHYSMVGVKITDEITIKKLWDFFNKIELDLGLSDEEYMSTYFDLDIVSDVMSGKFIIIGEIKHKTNYENDPYFTSIDMVEFKDDISYVTHRLRRNIECLKGMYIKDLLTGYPIEFHSFNLFY